MDTSKLKKFAQEARRALLEQVASKLSLVLQLESSARREAPKAVYQLEQALSEQGKAALIDKVAYIWFNRFCALRFMDMNGYNRVGVVSPAEGQIQPEILSEAKAGHIDDSLVNARAAERVVGLLNGSIKSQDGQTEAYRQLIVAVCNNYHSLMPYLFPRIDDYSELLMPDDLLSENSVLSHTRSAMTADACDSVEVIGWLYQFYISEKKDKVFADLKNNKKVTAENIPAATQLFTPHWIVRYLVENSLGRLWLLNNPNSRIAEKMDYYIKPEQPETDFLKITSPEQLKICDPAAGSGHMLTYAYDLLYAIYLDAGYDPINIPELILTKNLYGIEIDERASELAAFALSMKAMKGNPEEDGNNRRRFFKNPIKPNICKLEKITFTDDELDEYFAFVGKDLFTADLRQALKDFEEADNFGSLITPTISDVTEVLRTLETKDVSGQLFLTDTHNKVLQVLRQADYLSQKYHVVIANPPYMGGKGMNPRLSTWAKENYPDSKSDLFAMFMERNLAFAVSKGFSGMINMQSWMFLSSFENLRNKLFSSDTLLSMAHLGTRAFDSIGGEVVSTTAFVFGRFKNPNYRGSYLRLVDGASEKQKSEEAIQAIENSDCGWFFRASADDFGKIPGSPVAYWISERVFDVFKDGVSLRDFSKGSTGLQTSDGNQFVRLNHEVSISDIGIKWFRFAKGGGFRKWFGNVEHLVLWESNGRAIKDYVSNRYPYLNGNYGLVVKNESTYFKKGLLTSRVTAGKLSFRIKSENEIYADACTAIFPHDTLYFLSMLSTKLLGVVQELNPTINFQASDIEKFPVFSDGKNLHYEIVAKRCIEISERDWNGYETSLDFRALEILNDAKSLKSLESSYQIIYKRWKQAISEIQSLEEENNRIFIDAYGLQDELTPEVPIEEITLTCNPAYRYGTKISEDERENRLRADTMAEFLSYAVGCMFGRYSLDEPGLILANQGERLEDYLARIPTPTFMPDEDNVIPLIDFDGDWFEDDITELFKRFLKVTFGEQHFAENLAFIEDALGKDITKYFLKDFYKDHVQRYKKRPIYWLFSSPKGTFNALIYMHRYHPDTASVVLNEYLREFRTKLEARKDSNLQISISASASQKEKTQALKMIDKINKALDEINEYEREVLFPLAAERISIDLDDGVKHNYPLFGKALKKIAGLEGGDND